MPRSKQPPQYHIIDGYRFAKTGDEAALFQYLKKAKRGKRREVMVELMLTGFRSNVLRKPAAEPGQSTDDDAPQPAKKKINFGATSG